MPPELLIFDWDGTVMDSIPRIVAVTQASFARLGMTGPPSEAIRAGIGLSVAEYLARLAPGLDQEQNLNFHTAFRELWRSDLFPMPEPFAGVLQALEQLLDRGLILAVATGKSRVSLDRDLAFHPELGRLFHFTLCADESRPKPHPAMVHTLLCQAEASPQRALVVGDSLFDLQMARAAAVRAFGVASGCLSESDLQNLDWDARLPGVAALPKFLSACASLASS